MTTAGLSVSTSLDGVAAGVRVGGPEAQLPRAVWEMRYVARLAPIDALVGLCAALAALLLRFGPTVGESGRVYAWLTVLLPVAWLVALMLSRAYEARNLFVGNDEYQRVLRAGLGLTATTATVLYASGIQVARGYLLIAMPALVVLGVVARYLARAQLHRAWAHGRCLRRVVVVGHGAAVRDLTHRLRRERFHGMEVVAACLPTQFEAVRSGAPVHGTFDDVAVVAWQSEADTVIVLSCPELDGTAVRRLAWQLERDDIDLILASALIDVAGDRTTLRPVDGLSLLYVEHPRLRGARRLIKSIVDRLAALAALVLFAPVLLVIAAVVRWQRGARGRAIFRQVRVGRDGAEFVIYKFRTMYTDAESRLDELRHLNEHDGVLFKLRDDPRVTRVGKWLRRYSLDELPQLLNVVRGEMSLVGPRPPLPKEVAEYPADMRRRLVVKPGLTGLWQVSGRADLDWEEAIRLDLRYVENWSLTLDAVIVLRTLTAVVRTAGAY